MSDVAAPARRADFLAGVRVLELGDGVAGAAATNMLWALGAEVTAVVDPSSVHRRGRPSVDVHGQRASVLSVVLDRGKRLVASSDQRELDALLAGGDATHDVVIVDRVGGVHGPLARFSELDRYVGFVDTHNAGVWVTISAFGLTGERAGDVATEITVAAAGGMLAAARDERSGLPLKLGGQQSLLNTGQVGALAACHGLDVRAHDGPVHLDLSAVEATIATGPTLEVGNLMLETGSPGGARRYGAPASFYECTDGLIRVSAMEDHQWHGVVQAMGSPAWTKKFDAVTARIAGAEEIDDRVASWTRERSKVDAEALLQARGVPATAMYSPGELLDSPQLAHRDAFDLLPIDGRRARVVGLPFRVVDDAADDADVVDRRRRRSLRGLRVLEAGRVLAVPLASALLGTLGAEVTKLEDMPRLDMYRRRGPYIAGEQGTEHGAYFALVNHSKRSAAFDVDAARDRLDALVNEADVVIENLGPKRASALGIGAACVGAHPDLLAVTSSGFGVDGPHARYRAYAYNLQASCGLGYLTRNVADEPAEIDIAWADLISAYSLATIIAAWAVGPAGNAGAGIDFAMADLVVAHFNEFLAAASLDPESDRSVDRANELAPFAPHGVYPTADGWLALGVVDDDQFTHLVELLAHESLTDPTFARAEDRFEQRSALDERIAEATRPYMAAGLAAELRAVGISAEPVMRIADVIADAHLASRGFLTEVEHPAWGRRRLVGVPWRPFGGPALALGPPPLLEPEGA